MKVRSTATYAMSPFNVAHVMFKINSCEEMKMPAVKIGATQSVF